MTPYLSRFDVAHYRGLDSLSLPKLGSVNLLTGMNGAGKTALIEAIWLFVGRYTPGLFWNANVLRTAAPVVNPVSRLSKDTIELRGTENGSQCALKATFDAFRKELRPVPKSGEAALNIVPTLTGIGRLNMWIDGRQVDDTVSMHNTPRGVVLIESPSRPSSRPSCIIDTASGVKNPNEVMQRYSEMVKEGLKQKLLHAIELIDSDISDIEILTDEFGESNLSVSDSNGSRLALPDLGGGFARLFGTYLSFFAARDGLVLVDELENGIHHSVLAELWRRIRGWREEWNVQVFVTTHSAECIAAATEAFADEPEGLCVHKLFANRELGRPEAVTFTGETLAGARDLGLEVR